MPFFVADSISFHYLDSGQGLPFVFQHGLGGDVHQPEGIFTPPLPFRLVTLDCRGHGETSPLGDPAALKFNQFADDLLALLDHLKLPQVVVGGISMGAGVALNFALRYPQRVKGLILARPAWLDNPLPANLQAYPRIAGLIRHVGPVAGAEQFRHTDDYLSVQHTFPAAADSLIKQFARPKTQEFVDILDRLPGDAPNRDRADWAAVQVPTIVLAHDRDPIHPWSYGQALAGAIPGAALIPITPKEVDTQQHARDMQQAIERFLLTI